MRSLQFKAYINLLYESEDTNQEKIGYQKFKW